MCRSNEDNNFGGDHKLGYPTDRGRGRLQC